jgi:hypothetical protein
MKISGRKVSNLRIHQPTLMDHVGNLSNPIDFKKGFKQKDDIDGTLLENGGVLIKHVNGSELYISPGNIASAQLFPEKTEVKK